MKARQILHTLPVLISGIGNVHAGTDTGFSIGQDRLSGGRESWRNESIFVEHKNDTGTLSGLRINTTRRFGLNDHQLEGFHSRRLTDKLRLGIDASISPSHQVLARHAAGGNLQYEFSRGWLVHGGARHTVYDAVSVAQVSGGIEHYFGNWGAALTVYNSHAYDEHNQTIVARLSRYYGDKNRINLMLASGREPASIAGGIVNSDVRSVTLTGRYWLRPTLAVDYAVSTAQQGDFYSRTGGSIGLVISF